MNCYLYRHFDIRRRLLYVGISLRALSRLDQHRIASLWFDQIAHVTIERFPDRDSAMVAEKAAIKIENPLFNIVHAAPLDESYDERMVRLWNTIIDIEPRIWDLYVKAVEAEDDRHAICANKIWYDNLKPKLCELVGYGAKDSRLRHPIAYEVVYHTVYRALPNCRNCEEAW